MFHPALAFFLPVVAVIVFVGLCCAIVEEAVATEEERNDDVGSKSRFANDSRFIPLAMVKFLDDMEREKPIRFTSRQLRKATDNFTIKLGSGGFGAVYKGIVRDNTHVAVKVLQGRTDDIIEQQFMSEMSTLGRTHHFNLVRLYGFCFDSSLRALVYEFMVNGSLDKYLFKPNQQSSVIGFEKLIEIALGTARGITYLHEECPQIIVHYDIKPDNILLDSNFCAKVADFGLARLWNRDNSHITVTGYRGTWGYVAPELWWPLAAVTQKCDVYSFGVLLFEIICRRKSTIPTLDDSQKWLPAWVWNQYEKKQLKDLMIVCRIEEKDEQVAERMLKLALCCVHDMHENRPVMSMVVKMLEGKSEVPEPLYPFSQGGFNGFGQAGNTPPKLMVWCDGGSSSEATSQSTGGVNASTIMRKYEIEVASQ